MVSNGDEKPDEEGEVVTSRQPRSAGDLQALFENAHAARNAGDLIAAGKMVDTILQSAPDAAPALHLRARIALDRAEASALSYFDAALRYDPGNPDLHLGKAQALDRAGDRKGARIVAEQIATQAPGFTAALSFLSSLYLADGEQDFTAPFTKAASKAPQDPNIPAAHCDALAGIGYHAQAAAVAAQASMRFPEEPHFRLLEAMHTGSAGEWQRADRLFDTLALETTQEKLAKARHLLRAGRFEAADDLLGTVLWREPSNVSAWALQDTSWRAGDSAQALRKAQWLHAQSGLIQFRPLAASPDLLARVRKLLSTLHKDAGMPLAQSLRGGSQTRGNLLQRTEPELAELRAAIEETVARYRAELPDADAEHPLLRHREADWGLAGSWSVRLTGAGDRHATHVHPAGIISSALYVTVPPEISEAPQDGWLELGRPPHDLGLDLEPLETVRPQEGHLALFPSTLYHGTRQFSGCEAERVTVAFDVVASATQR
ncbi:MAG: putative 2OG-Fe(II) oxygenase [Pseudomonadota bacterium]|nr:putative 2OG-Fe(II) oxygenase [Pseudomonadota bacterium]